MLSRIQNSFFLVELVVFSLYFLATVTATRVAWKDPRLLLWAVPVALFAKLMRYGMQSIWLGMNWLARGVLIVSSAGIFALLLLLIDGHTLLLGKLFYRGSKPLPLALLPLVFAPPVERKRIRSDERVPLDLSYRERELILKHTLPART